MGGTWRANSPPGGSTFSTSAPMSAISRVQYGPAINRREVQQPEPRPARADPSIPCLAPWPRHPVISPPGISRTAAAKMMCPAKLPHVLPGKRSGGTEAVPGLTSLPTLAHLAHFLSEVSPKDNLFFQAGQ